jgi:hypothetical protein
MIRDVGFDEDEAAKSRQGRRAGPCELCGREGKALTFHHLIPRHCHRKKRFRNRFTIETMRASGLWLCGDCHHGIHDLIPDEKLLGWCYHTRDLLLAHDGVRKHVDWVRKKR